MTLTSVGSHLQPEVFRQIFKTFSFLKCVLRVKRAGDCWNYLPSKLLPSNWSDSYGATVLWTLCPLRTFPSQHPLLSYRKQVHHHLSYGCLFTLSPWPALPWPTRTSCGGMKLRQSEFHQISSDHVGCGRKRVAKQGRCKKKADILFNLAMSGGMSGVTTTVIIVT